MSERLCVVSLTVDLLRPMVERGVGTIKGTIWN
jgi:hypothetical protein